MIEDCRLGMVDQALPRGLSKTGLPWGILACAFLSLLACRAGASGTTGADILSARLATRAAALGDSYVALGDDAFAPVYNPAGLAEQKDIEISFLHWAALADVNYENVVWAEPFDFGNLSASVVYRYMPDINNPEAVDGPVASNDLLATVSYARALGDSLADLAPWIPEAYRKVSAGLNLKLLKSHLGSYDAYAFAIDAGLRGEPYPGTFVGLSILNLGSPIQYISAADPLPAMILLGAAERLSLGGSNILNATVDLEQRLADIALLSQGEIRSHFGIEDIILDTLALRIGYSYGPTQSLGGFTGGVGIKLDQAPLVFELDYAFHPAYYNSFSSFDPQHLISVSIGF